MKLAALFFYTAVISVMTSCLAFAGNGGAVPEPPSLAILGMGAAGVAAWRIFRRRK